MASESLINQLSQSFYDANGTPNERLDKYCSKDVHKIVIDGNPFTGYKTYSFFWEKTYVKEPERSSDGTISNLNSYATFITPHLQIKFSLMSMEDYRRLYNLILSKNEFVVTCYNPINNETTTNKMYFYPDSLPKLNIIARNILNKVQGEKWVELLGVQDYTIEMVGTNNQLGGLIVQYEPNVPSDVSSSLTTKTIDVSNGQEILIGKGAEAIINEELVDINGQKWVFDYWLDNNNVTLTNDRVLLISSNVVLKAQWKQSDSYTLVYNYGIGEPQVDYNGNAILTKLIKYNDPYGALYQSSIPSVTFDGVEYKNAYTWEGWFKTPKKGTNSVAIKSTDLYNVQGNSTIYQIIEPNEYTLTFNSNGGTAIQDIKTKFNTSIAIPIPTKQGKTFNGWYYDSALKKKFDGIMPPKNSTLYADWK